MGRLTGYRVPGKAAMNLRNFSPAHIPFDGIAAGLLFFAFYPHAEMWMAVLVGAGMFVARQASWLWALVTLCGIVLFLIGSRVVNDNVAYAYMFAFGGMVYLGPVLIGLYTIAKKRNEARMFGLTN